MNAIAYLLTYLVNVCVGGAELTEWSKTDEKLMKAVKHCSVDNIRRLACKKTLQPTKLDPARGTTA